MNFSRFCLIHVAWTRVSENEFLSQHDDERTRKIEVLSRKLEDLFEEHFGNLDFDNITGSPRENLLTQLRLKTSGQKSIAGRCDGTRKAASSAIIAEDPSLH